ncbi:MAG: TetR/AcrR family transcriptional regulator C-terminal domain-containing protein [Pseudobutyrivibrio sp.]|nr:TetR/AcrR family transcriptional regulator C-terminal domain-containing protein [Pseudobutyrivibrio sp.]
MNSQSQREIDAALAESLKELAATKPIEKITIKEITDKAGVIRPTFYNHFQDKYELLEWIVKNEVFAPAEPLMSAGMLKEAVTFILTTLENGKAFYKKAVQLEGQNSFNEIIDRCVYDAIENHLDINKITALADYPWFTSQLVAEFLSHAISWGIIEWIKKGMTVPVTELADVYVKLFNRSIIEVVAGNKNK